MCAGHGTPTAFLKTFDEYATKPDKKAIALALENNGAWAAGYSYRNSSEVQAWNKAFDECAKRVSQYNIRTSCKLYAVGTRISW